MNKIKYLLMLMILAVALGCQDDDNVEPKEDNSATGTAEVATDYDGGAYDGVPRIMSAGEIFSDFDFETSHSNTSWLTADGNEFALGDITSEAARLNLLGDETFTVNIPAVSPGSEDATIEFDVSTPGGYADAAYQVARAYQGDFDNDGIEDTVAYAAIVLPAVSTDSAGAIAALLVGKNFTLFGSATTDNTVLAAYGAIGTHLAGRPGIIFARKLTLSSVENDSASGSRNDSGFSAVVVPIGLLAAAGNSELTEDADAVNNTTDLSDLSDASLALIACLAAGGTPEADGTGGDDCNTDAAGDAKVAGAQGLAQALTINGANTYTNGTQTSANALSLANSATTDDAVLHSAKVRFAYQGGGLAEIQVVLEDASGNSYTYSNDDVNTFDVAAVTGAELPSQSATQSACGQESATDVLTIEPALFKNQNVFAAGDDTCNAGSGAGVMLSNSAIGTRPLYTLLNQASLTGYAVSLGNVVAAAISDESKFSTVIEKNGYKSVTISNLKIKAYAD